MEDAILYYLPEVVSKSVILLYYLLKNNCLRRCYYIGVLLNKDHNERLYHPVGMINSTGLGMAKLYLLFSDLYVLFILESKV